MSVNQLLQKAPADLPLLQANFGLERESLRIDKNTQRVAQSPHPDKLGSRTYHPYIQTDYSEPQMEMITPVAHSTKQALRFLEAITDVASRSIATDQYLWPLSMPPKITEAEIKMAQLEDPFEYSYRQYLGEKYGKLLQSMSGIHYNMELGADLFKILFKNSGYTSFLAFKNDLYLKLAQNFLTYRWLLTYLYGASPIAEKGFFEHNLKQPVRSIRNSRLGYANSTDIQVPFDNLQNYVSKIESYVQNGQLSAEKEFYSSVRLRGSKHNRDYLTKGITYLEFRCFDLNPFTNLAITQDTLDTVHLFALAMLWLDAPKDSQQTIEEAQALNEKVALSHPLEKLPQKAPYSLILEAMAELIEHFKLPLYYKKLLSQIKEQIKDPSLTIGGRLYQKIQQSSLEVFGQQKGQKYQDYAWQAYYALKGYENMELSTQMLLFDVIQKGVHFELLDENDQFLKLWHKNHIEYVKNGNMTSKDNYVIPLAMANKVVTKKILKEAGFSVPEGAELDNKDDALRYYAQIKNKAIVVKPKSTNFGLGISIFKEPSDPESYAKALDIAFSEDSSILVEEYIAGTEYRFFILDGKCEAVLLRIAANVVGDGQTSIRELIAEKNQNPLRGRNHRSPLEIINLGNIELLMLSQQGYSPDDILPKGVRVNLRENSNISTGGDSIDFTEKMPASYKKLAAKMARAMGAWACGVDLIIPDTNVKASQENPNYTCIELNFNPSMYMHTYCHEGPGQIITGKILKKLFPELNIHF
ncbi:bifunctional glutamate--cysteine ligase GshA/glutathione synthetase GshB [Streptococcus macacae]|uniref:Glutathione biosynthesis bifunctional protein GshAB n=1 Tax=Streptococcus macacae NCTC 11558 TaxID=764298 RepID=G5JW55_9STRE|nr:bifunctional glutamate--cysteine ligase GshA/glutathione synthetase GshB [Streptococcus macacae]EHJ53270.1 glutamate--cysteine ligase/gamma-glutamylcysteine synthetase [Streptococcus macacae NCTC 11558]SUN79396.1 putative glutamate-cysteine ligase [Streptococcus macacae NCTC 11558]